MANHFCVVKYTRNYENVVTACRIDELRYRIAGVADVTYGKCTEKIILDAKLGSTHTLRYPLENGDTQSLHKAVVLRLTKNMEEASMLAMEEIKIAKSGRGQRLRQPKTLNHTPPVVTINSQFEKEKTVACAQKKKKYCQNTAWKASEKKRKIDEASALMTQDAWIKAEAMKRLARMENASTDKPEKKKTKKSHCTTKMNCTESNGTKHVRSSPKTPTSKTKPVNVNTAKSTVASVPSDDCFESIMNLNWHDDNTMDSSASAPTTSAVDKGTNETTNCTESNGIERLRSSPKTPISETKSVDGNTAETIVASEPNERCELKTKFNWYDNNAIDSSATVPTTSSVDERANETKNCTECNGTKHVRSSPKTSTSKTKPVNVNTAKSTAASVPSDDCFESTINLNWHDDNTMDSSASAPTTSAVDKGTNETTNCTASNGIERLRSSPKTPASEMKSVEDNTAETIVASEPSERCELKTNLNWYDDNAIDFSAIAPTTSSIDERANETKKECTGSEKSEHNRSSADTAASNSPFDNDNVMDLSHRTSVCWKETVPSSSQEILNVPDELITPKNTSATYISGKDSQDMVRSEETGATESRACICTEDEKKFAATTSQDSSIVDLLDEENLLMSQNSNAQNEEEPEARMELQIPTTPDGSPKCTEGDSSNKPKYRSETSALDAHRTYTAVNTVTNSELTTKVRIRSIRQLAKEEVLDGKALKRSRKRPNDRNAYEIEDTPQRDLAVTYGNVFETTAAAKDASSSEFLSSQTPEQSSTESGLTSPDCHVPRYCMQKAAYARQSEPSLPRKNRRRRISSEDSSDETDDESLGKKKEKRDKKRMKIGTKHRGYRSSEKYHTSEDIARLARSVNAKWEKLWKRTAALATSMARSDDGVPVRTNKLTIPAADEDNMVTLVPGGRFSRSCVARAAEAKWMRKRMNILVEDFWPLEQRCKLTLMMKKRNAEYRTITKKEIDILTAAAKILERTHPLNDGDINDSRAVRTWISAKIKSDRNRLSRIGSTSNTSRSGTSPSLEMTTSTDDCPETVEQVAAATTTQKNKQKNNI